MKALKDYDVDEVAIWLNCIGLGDKVDPFRENAVDGDMLLSLEPEDLKGDLGLTSLQAKKVQRSIESTNEIIASGSTGGGEDLTAKVAALESENAALQKQLAEFQPKAAPAPVPAPAPAPAPVPAPAPAPAPPPKQNHGVVRGAARGAAGGAAKGAIVGAIVPGMDASDGAKAGAAVGATKGGVRGLRGRRR